MKRIKPATPQHFHTARPFGLRALLEAPPGEHPGATSGARSVIVPPTARAATPRPTREPATTATEPAAAAATDADAVEREAQVLARAMQIHMESRGTSARAPSVRTDATRERFSAADVPSMMRDFGATANEVDARNRSIEDYQAIVRGDPKVWSDKAQADRAQARGERNRMSGFVRKRQFTEMSGRRHTLATLPRHYDNIETLIAGGPNGHADAIGRADIGFAQELGMGDFMSRWIGYLVLSKRGDYVDPQRAAGMAYDSHESDTLVRALGETTATAGGLLVPDVVSENVIELYYAVSVFLQGQPVRMTLANGVLTLPRISSGATHSWLGENQALTPTDLAFDAPRIVLRKLGGEVITSNDLIRHSPQSVPGIIQADLQNGGGATVDLAAIRGSGSAYQPLGVENQCPAANKFNQTGTTAAAITTDFGKQDRLLEEAKVPRVRPYRIMAPRTKWALMTLRDGNNNLIWAPEMVMGTLMGVPFGATTNVPVNLGGGTNESKTYRLEMSEEIWAEGVGADGAVFDSRDGVAYESGGVALSAFSRDQTVSRLLQKVDIVSRRSGVNISMIEAQTIA